MGKKNVLLWGISITAFLLCGCGDGVRNEAQDELYRGEDTKAAALEGADSGAELPGGDGWGVDADAERIEEVCRDIYDQAARDGTLGSLDTMRRMVAELGENGYTAVDSGNQIDMAGSEQVLEFCRAVEEKEAAELTIAVVMQLGFRVFELRTQDGNVDIVRGYYQYDQNGCLQNRDTVSYPADFWQYTQEGYLCFEGSSFSYFNYVLTLSNTPEHTMVRVLPLDEKCREWNRKCILPVGYGQNNLFLCDWSREDYGALDFYDLFDRLYPMIYRQPLPYITDERYGIGGIYTIPEDMFENVIESYFQVDRETLHSRTTYLPDLAAYEYRPRGIYEAQFPDIAYPEVVGCAENEDGTVALRVNAVYPNGNSSREFSHITMVYPLNEDSFRYVSNEMLLPEEDYEIWWHSDRLTEEEWKEIYGE